MLFYGLYNTGSTNTDALLLDIITLRGRLASVLDTVFLGTGVSSVLGQVLFDMVLTALDRSIDLLALGADGTTDDDFKRARAFAHWMIIRSILMVLEQNPLPLPIGSTANSLGTLTFDDRLPNLNQQLGSPFSGGVLPDQLAVENFGPAVETAMRDEARQIRRRWGGTGSGQSLDGTNSILLSTFARQATELMPRTDLYSSILEELLIQGLPRRPHRPRSTNATGILKRRLRSLRLCSASIRMVSHCLSSELSR